MEAIQRRNLGSILLLFVVALLGATAQGAEPFPQASRYLFDAEQSTILQSGGIAGVNWRYAIDGSFCLIVDSETGSARFAQVDANAVDESEPTRALDPNTVFGLEGLAGTVVDAPTITFTGSVDIRAIDLTVTFEDDAVLLTGTAFDRVYDGFFFEIDAVATRKYAGGTGDPNTPYQIATAAQMNAIGADPNDYDKHFILTTDIDLAPFDGREGRPAFNVIARNTDPGDWNFHGIPFTGVFDGAGHTVTNFCWSESDTGYAGLFGYVSDPNAEIRNLALIDPNIHGDKGFCFGALVGYLEQGVIRNCSVDGGTIVGCERVGGLVGQVYGECEIVDCHATTAVSGGYDMGGLVGSNTGIIENCYADCLVVGDQAVAVGGLVGLNAVVRAGRPPAAYAISSGSIRRCYATGMVSGDDRVGGLVGVLYSGSSVSDCYATVSVHGDIYVGGLVGGSSFGVITNCYAAGVVAGKSNAGGLVGGTAQTLGEDVGSFWDVETSEQDVSVGGTGLPTADMQQASTFLDAGWDFVGETENGTEDIWWIDEGQGYPRLWWEHLGDNLIVLVLDDFEHYTTDEGNYFWVTWNDGWVNNTGAMIGCLHELCALQAEVTFHGGRQSMPFEYNNDGPPYYSETERIWEDPQNWTVSGADTLTLYFIGQAENEPDNLYVAIEDDAGAMLAVTHPDSDAGLATEWQEWHIPLTDFRAADVHVSSVRKLVIGVGNRDAPRPGGTGRIFLDDIQLTKRMPRS